MKFLDNSLPTISIEEILQSLDLNDKEAKVLHAALKFGKQPASVIANKANIPRSSVFFPLKNLIKKGLIKKEIRANVSYFKPVSTDEIKSLFAEKVEQAEKGLKDFTKISHQLSALKENTNLFSSHIMHFEGINGIRRQIDDYSSSDEDIYFISNHDTHPKIKEYIVDKYIPSRKKSEGKAYMIVNDSDNLHKCLKLSAGVYDEVYIVPEDKYQLVLRMAIYGNRVSFISGAVEDMTGVIIENQFIADHMRTIFMMIRDQYAAEKITKEDILNNDKN